MMKGGNNYIATWFYKENKDEASFYPQGGGRGDSPLLHSIYMQIQVPFFATFRHFNPDAVLMFFTNIDAAELPPYLHDAFKVLDVRVVKLPYTCRPPKGWHDAWQNQFYIYDILKYMETAMYDDDCLLVCDADCICRSSLKSFFDGVRTKGSALYELHRKQEQLINGTTLAKMAQIYADMYGKSPEQPLYYYGGEFFALRKDMVEAVNSAFPPLWKHNIGQVGDDKPKLCEEAHVLSMLAEFLGIRNADANKVVKRMWTNPGFRSVVPEDVDLAVWHLPYEKKRGLYYMFQWLMKNGFRINDETEYQNLIKFYNGIPVRSWKKMIYDRFTTLKRKIAGK